MHTTPVMAVTVTTFLMRETSIVSNGLESE